MKEIQNLYLRSAFTSFGFFTVNLMFSVFSIFVPIFLNDNLKELLGDKPIIYFLVGLIMVLDNIAAILIQPYIGSLSDRTWVRKLGRRMPFIIIGLPLAALFFGLISTFESTLYLLIIAICGYNISMAFYGSPVISLIADTLPRDFHTRGNGVLNIFGGLANITGFLLSSYLIKINSPLKFWPISFIAIFCLIILILTVREKKEAEIEITEKVGFNKTIKELFKDKNFILLFLLFAVFAHNTGYQSAETFFSSYAINVLHFDKDQAGYILGIFVVIQIILALPAALISKKIGALNASILGVIGFLCCMIPIAVLSLIDNTIIADIITLNGLSFTWEFFLYTFLILILGLGWILVFINLLVVVWNLTPPGKIATYTGFYYIFWNLAAILGPAIAGGIFSLVKKISGYEGSTVLFVYVLVCYFFAIFWLSLVKIRLNRKLKQELSDELAVKKYIMDRELPLKFIPLILFGRSIRQTNAYMILKQEHKEETKELKEKIKAIRKLSRKDKEVLSTTNKMVLLKEHRKLKRQKKKEQKEEINQLKEEILIEKITEHLEEESNASQKKNNGKE